MNEKSNSWRSARARYNCFKCFSVITVITYWLCVEWVQSVLWNDYISVSPSPLSPLLSPPPPPLCCKILLWVFYFMPYHATHDGAFPVFIRQHKHGSTDHKAGPEKITTWAETQAWQRRLRCAGTGFKDRGGSVGCREYSHHNLSLTWSSPCNACSPKYF